MADLTILSPASLPSFPFSIGRSTEDLRKKLAVNEVQVSPAIAFTFTEATFDDDVPASQTATRPEVRHDPFLLSPPKARPGRVRRVSAPAKVQSSSIPPPIAEEDEDEEELTGEGERAHSYTRSFRPFTYPSSPNLLGFEDASGVDLPRPPPPLCSYIVRRSTFVAAGLNLDRPREDLSALGVELRVTGVVLDLRPGRNMANHHSSQPTFAPSEHVYYWKRQDSIDFVSSTSSFDYWWTFPPAVTSTTSDTDSDPTLSTDSSSTTDSTNDSSSSQASESLSESSVNSNSTTTGTSFTSDPSLIRITALPPLPSSSLRHAQNLESRPFNPLVLTPIFVIVGVILGFFCGTWLFRARNRGRLCLRQEKTIAGPRYVSVDDGDKFNDSDGIGNESISEKERFMRDARKGPSSPSSKPEEGRQSSQFSRGWTNLLRSPLTFGEREQPYTPVSHLDGNDTPVMERKSRVSIHQAKGGSAMREVLSPSAPSEFTYSGASSQGDGTANVDDEDEDFYTQARSAVASSPINFARHKSIRQRILEKIQQGFSPRSRREESRRRGTPQLEEGSLLKNAADSSMDEQSPLKRVKSKLAPGRPGHHGRAISDFSVVPTEIQTPGKAHVSMHASGGREIERIKSAKSFQSSSSRKFEDDKYTALPERRIRASRTRSVQESPIKSSYSQGSSTPLHRSYSSANVLPNSPPLLESPHLNSALFFGSRNATPTSAMLQSLESDSPTSPMKSQRKLVKSGKAYPESSPFGRMASRHGEIENTATSTRRTPSGPRQANKLHSPKKSNYLRSDDDSPSPTKRRDASTDEKPLPRTPTRQASVRRPYTPSSTPTGPRARPSSNTPGRTTPRSRGLVHSPSSPKERFEARRSALDKVTAIVSKSYSTRDLQGFQRPSSPSMFGSQANDASPDRLGSVSEETCLLPGIEQRLTGYE
ncbi:hypothetical protein SCHPADRAFT_925433 [Schizopora paradoxa]|uniref:Uncharacterized protein n=1 Tax=Schizopora paradoxa TaxID=27342 RepID=A0A0H2S8V9_9AGAM|nr:hypothetical protein SCHPADRAFT_925433 [Schizopora paradoxa]